MQLARNGVLVLCTVLPCTVLVLLASIRPACAQDTHGREPSALTASTGPGPGPFILIVFGAASAIACGALIGVTAEDFALVENATGVPWEGEVRAAWERAPQESVAAAVSGGVAALMLGFGIVWLAIGGDDDQLSIGPGGWSWRHVF